MRTRRLLALVLLSALTGCGAQRAQESPNPAVPVPDSSPQPRAEERAAVDVLAPAAPRDPSDFQWSDPIFHFLAEGERVVDASPWTACLGTGCWDGAPGLGGPIPSVGSPDALYFAFDYPGWKFNWVTFTPIDDACGGRSATVRATPVTDRVFRIDPVGPPGDWHVDVFGRAPAGGDAVTSVLWSTPDGGSVVGPRARSCQVRRSIP